MRNAFNSLKRDTFLPVTLVGTPGLYSLLWRDYSSPTRLFFGEEGFALLKRQRSPGILTGSVKIWLWLLSEAMRSVISQPVLRGFRGSGDSGGSRATTNPSLCSGGKFLFHERFYYACFDFEDFNVLVFLRK